MDAKTKYIVLDRDGVINIERGEYTFKTNDFKLVEGFIEGMTLLADAGYKFIVISNQGGIAKGLYTLADVKVLEGIVIDSLAIKSIAIDAFYYCPHHPDYGKCLCRKPAKLIFEKASAKYAIDVANSWMIGDKERDILPAADLGFKTLQIEANTNFLIVAKHILT